MIFGAALFYHHFEDDEFDVAFGDEVDVVLTKKLNKNASLLAKGAYFFGDLSPDITRMSVEMNYKF